MQKVLIAPAAALAAAMLLVTAPARAQDSAAGHDHAHDHSHAHDEAHAHAHDDAIYRGYFDDAQVAPRPLSDWEGAWQSVYPLLQDGTLDPVMADKAAHGDKSAAEYRAYYDTGYATDVARIEIRGSTVTFHGPEGALSGEYASDGLEVLTYKAGNRGVRFIFARTAGDAAAPAFIQFSDHRIAPAKADHYHIYMGDDRAALLEEVTNWPTYYPAALSPGEIVQEMLAH
ncbi:metal-binding protein ZinT [Oceanicella sp. SM1341]|uniref:ZinT family metal-binding protein n=1 Tax=Oceanicella sp. SM1341 TaxID=1548889 RepID=UPI000E490188|nr:metal-binding protein ZinT [Oceanicella sp. SM1341]